MYKQLLINKKIRYYLLGGGVSKLGDVLTGMAFLFITYDVTGSPYIRQVWRLPKRCPIYFSD